MPRAAPPLVAEPQPIWAFGVQSWKTPIGWGNAGSYVRRRMSPDEFYQTYVMEEDGTLTVTKYGHSIKRSPAGQIWLDGRRVQ